MESQRVSIITRWFGANCDKHEPKLCGEPQARRHDVNPVCVPVCGLSFSTAGVCGACVCLLRVERPVESTRSCQRWKGHPILSLLFYKRTVTLYIRHLPATYLTEQENTHTTWCLINQHFGNIILSNPDQSHRQLQHHHRSYSAILHISCTKSTIKCSALPLTYCKGKQSLQ